MKCDMRAPSAGGTDYLLIFEAETALERTALAHFTAKHPDEEELCVIMRVPAPLVSRGFRGSEDSEVVQVFMAWQERKAYTPPVAAIESGAPNGS